MLSLNNTKQKWRKFKMSWIFIIRIPSFKNIEGMGEMKVFLI
jgi:hypothetical protein